MDKLQGSKAFIYSRQKVPLMFCIDPKHGLLYPSLYLLFKLGQIAPLQVFLKEGVEQYIFNGADLMWPGISGFSNEEFKANDVAVIYAKNKQAIGGSNLEYFPVGVGKMLSSSIPANLKGKAVQVEHYLYDNLWSMGPKKIPEEIQVERIEGLQPQEQQEIKESETNGQNDQEEEKQVRNKVDELMQPMSDRFEEEKGQSQADDQSDTSDQKVPVEDMDARIIEAFYRSLIECVKDTDLPMEPSDFLKDHLSLYSDINYKLDLRNSSFKRIGKLLEIMHKKGVIDYSEPRAISHKMITKIIRTNEELKSYVPKFSLRKNKKAATLPTQEESKGGPAYPKVEINEVFLLSKHLNCVLANVKDFDKSCQYFGIKEVRDLLTQYIKENKLDEEAKKGFVKVDPILAQIISNKASIQDGQVKKEQLFNELKNHLIDCYQVVNCDEAELSRDKIKYHRGSVPEVKVWVHRVQNKKQTVITGLELYRIDYDELQTYLSHKCSCSVSMQMTPSEKQSVLLQGNHLEKLAHEILPKRYKIPQKYIKEQNDLGTSKKKKGKNCPHLTEANLTKNLQGRLIYKDECTKCFANAKSDTGVDVCLKCFNGGCVSQEFNHSLLHYNMSNHPITMNIRQVLKDKDEMAKPAQITKLAIGKPGGIDPDVDNYDTIIALKCQACNKLLDHTNPIVSGLVDSILLSQSAYFQSTLQEWELKLESCTHTKNLDQSNSQRIAAKSMAHCQECDLSANLWLCMTCGHLGCGRKNWDGSGGNNHAIDHYQSHMHPVVCKLGTITPEGTASIYCYACDEDRNDDKLADHLGTLGIDVKQQTKTEKTVQEMDLELNLNFTLSKILEEGKELIPMFGAGFTGMENLGNSCYMNSVLQILFSQPEFKNKYLDNAHIHLMTCSKFAPDCLDCQISKLVDGIFSGRYSEKKVAKKIEYEGQSEEEKQKVDYTQDGIKPHMFKHLVGKDHPEFKTAAQQDAQEYFFYLLEKIQRLEKQNKNTNPGEIFDFELETRVQCQECKGVKYNKAKVQQLTLQAPVESNVEKGTPVEFEACLQRFFGEEQIPDFQCSNCNKRTVCVKTQRINSFPRVMIIVLQRFVYDQWVPKKLEIELQVPQEFVDFERFRGTNGQVPSDEFLLPDANAGQEQSGEPELNQEILNMVCMMGIPENAAKHALYNTGNNSADMAATWYFEHMDDPVLNEPLIIKKAGGGGDDIPQELVEGLAAMGFPDKRVRKALKACDNNPDRAAEWLFSHMDDPDSDHEMTDVNEESPYKDDRPGIYNLNGFITHLGTSTHCGHYVCHIKRDGEWYYFNDAKVAKTNDPPIGKGYMYFFRKPDHAQD